MLIGISGSIGSGKSTVATHISATTGATIIPFAGALKDIVSVMMGWPRDWLDGETPEHREWRERVDPWWSERLNMPGLCPRTVMQQWGTDLGRNHFHTDIWTAVLERKIASTTGSIIVPDCRFKNEINLIRRLGGTLLRVDRGEPVTITHASESEWQITKFDHRVDNSGSLEHTYTQVNAILEQL